MAVLGGKSNPRLKNLNPFIKVLHALNKLNKRIGKIDHFQDSQIVQLICKSSGDQGILMKELDDQNGNKNFYMADSGETNAFILAFGFFPPSD